MPRSNQPNQLTADELSTLRDQFREHSSTLSELFASEGVKVAPYINSDLPFFSKLAVSQQQSVTETLRVFAEVCSESVEEGVPLKNAAAVTWKMLKRMGLTPKADLFSYITDDHIVEIYSHDNIQVFRNLKFFEICSYSLEELYSRQWWELFKRDDRVTRALFAAVSKIYTGEVKDTFFPNVERHWLEEIASPLKFSMHVDVEALSPLHRDGEVYGLCAVERAELKQPRPSGREIEAALQSRSL